MYQICDRGVGSSRKAGLLCLLESLQKSSLSPLHWKFMKQSTDLTLGAPDPHRVFSKSCNHLQIHPSEQSSRKEVQSCQLLNCACSQLPASPAPITALRMHPAGLLVAIWFRAFGIIPGLLCRREKWTDGVKGKKGEQGRRDSYGLWKICVKKPRLMQNSHLRKQNCSFSR